MNKNLLSSIVRATLIAIILMFGLQLLFKGEEKAPAKQAEKISKKIEHHSTPTLPVNLKDENLIHVETPLYTAKISTVNGKLVELKVKKYNAQLIAKSAKKLGIFPLMTLSSDRTLNRELASLNLTPNMTNITVNKKPITLKLSGKLPDGREFKKELTFYPDRYVIDVKASLNGSSENLITIVGPDIKVNEAHSSRMGHIGPIVETEKELIRLNPEEMNSFVSFSKALWAGEEDKYFLMALKGELPVVVEKVSNHTLVKGLKGNVTFFGGPKEISQLETLGMEKAIDFGIFGFLAKPFLKFFLFLHKFIPNWGLVIIVLTLIIKIILHPLTHKGFESMKKMQELAPKLEELKKRYKDNPQKLNEEMMKLYKEAGVNPMGGCLPMLLQIPVFFALYEIFLNAVELKGASFLWVSDLSMPDPTYLMPILMGASMILQQKLTPSTNPQQEKIFMILAVVFTFMFATFPAGLVLYWLTNNLITAIQNLIINKTLQRNPA